MNTEGRRIEVRGTVQGVGFRPWIYRLARETGVGGRVLNNPLGVTIEAFGGYRALDEFIGRLRTQAPAPARIRDLRQTSIPVESVDVFTIDASATGEERAFSIPPDLATCTECEAEVLERGNRRFRYPFTNCTHCGPRFTIATDVPYDRPATTMAGFQMCEACRREYESVEDRRFHAQPNACPECGPSLELLTPRGRAMRVPDPLTAAAELIAVGKIVAVKGLGGFHLACDAAKSDVVSTLRERKRRDEKPFAIMVRDLDAARALAQLSQDEEDLLCSPEHPIVLVKARPEAHVANEVSPNSPLLGIFLPYTPLHHLLLSEVDRPLVMTSANLAEEPICYENDEALNQLSGIADALLVHDRPIATRCDDSVARVIAGQPTVLRRSRGFVPRPVSLARPVVAPVLACGAHLKNTFCLASGDSAYLGPHVGDLENLKAFEFFCSAIERFEKTLSVRPQVIAHDLHPQYLSTRYARSRAAEAVIGVQHHHAHVVSAMAEHHLEGPVLGVAYDGTGYGTDGTSWGSELLLARLDGFERLGTFRAIALPGGDSAIRKPWRAAFSLVHDAFDGDIPVEVARLFPAVPAESLRVIRQMLERDVNAPLARGMGRYFDAIGALVLRRTRSHYEGQVAVAWNLAAENELGPAYEFSVASDGNIREVDLRPTVRDVVQDLADGVSPSRISARFHRTVIEATATIVRSAVDYTGRLPLVLTGGVFQNPLLVAGVREALSNTLPVVQHAQVPPNDGGIALGQALVADATFRRM